MENKLWPWGKALDVLTAAPEHHKLLLENERVRDLETLIPAGETTAFQNHCWPTAYHVVSWSHFLRTGDLGRKMVDSRGLESLANPPAVLWEEALPPYVLQNVGEVDLVLIDLRAQECPRLIAGGL